MPAHPNHVPTAHSPQDRRITQLHTTLCTLYLRMLTHSYSPFKYFLKSHLHLHLHFFIPFPSKSKSKSIAVSIHNYSSSPDLQNLLALVITMETKNYTTCLPLITSFIILIAVVSPLPAAAYTNHTVGGAAGWFFNVDTGTPAAKYSDWAAKKTFNLGDYLS